MKNAPITKKELGWLITRLIGIVFLWLSFNKIAVFGFAVYMLTITGYEEIRSTLGSRMSWDIAWPQTVSFLFYGLLSFYFLRHGSLFVQLLTRGSHGNRKDRLSANQILQAEQDGSGNRAKSGA